MKRRAIRITGKPGQTITLQTMGRLKSEIYSKEESEYWISSFHSGNHRSDRSQWSHNNLSDSSILALEADTVSHDRGMARKFNLLQSMNTFVWVDGEENIQSLEVQEPRGGFTVIIGLPKTSNTLIFDLNRKCRSKPGTLSP